MLILSVRQASPMDGQVLTTSFVFGSIWSTGRRGRPAPLMARALLSLAFSSGVRILAALIAPMYALTCSE